MQHVKNQNTPNPHFLIDMSELQSSARKLIKYIKEELENVSQLKKQLSPEQAIKLLEEYSKAEIHQTLLEMENHQPLSKKYISVYLTLQNWLKRNRRKSAKSNNKTGIMDRNESLTLMEKNNIPFENESDYFEVIKQDNGKPGWRLL